MELAEMIACVDRELAMRRQVYPRWVRDRKLTQATADREIARMLAVRSALLRGDALQRLLDRLETRIGGQDNVPEMAELLGELQKRFPVPA